MDDLQRDGLNPVLRSLIENAIRYRKWGHLGGWAEKRTELHNKVKKYQPGFAPDIFKLFNNA